MTVTTERLAPAVSNDPRHLIDAGLFDRLTSRIEKQHPELADGCAVRIMSQALAYLKACGDNPGKRLAPSPAVDIGWHAFLLYTRDYTEFCRQVAGRFIHHVPDDGESGTGVDDPNAMRVRTLDAINVCGFAVDTELWALPQECSNGGGPGGPGGGCHQGCHDSA